MLPFSYSTGLKHVLFYWDTVISLSENTDDAGTFSKATQQTLQAKSHHPLSTLLTYRECELLHQHFIRGAKYRKGTL